MNTYDYEEEAKQEQAMRKFWYAQAAEQTMETLPAFLEELLTYEHTYGTIVCAIAAGAIGTVWAMNRDSVYGGLTGFQASAVMWEFVQGWQFRHNKCGLSILDFDSFLYPQNEHQFDRIISQDIWEAIQNEAREKINERIDAHPDVIAHWHSIVDGNVPFGYKVKERES